MKNLLLSLVVFCASIPAFAQCDGRYLEEIFSEVEVSTHTYSEVYNLKLDVYEPLGDDVTNRPLLIIAHGGTFIAGTRTNPSMVALGNAFAKRGYVVASISYRLMNIWDLATAPTALNGVAQALGDGRAAVRYFRKSIEEGNPFAIDGDQIYFGGNSAGGVIAIHAAFMQEADITDEALLTALNANGGIEGNSGNDGYSSEVKGAISLAGGIADLAFIEENDFSKLLISCHGDEDSTVPFECDFPLSNPVLPELCGGGAISDYASVIGFNKLRHLTFEGAGHVPWEFGGTNEETMINFVSANLYEDLDCYVGVDEFADEAVLEVFPNPTESKFTIKTAKRIYKFVISNLKGVKVFQAYNTSVIDIEHLPKGIYLVEAYTENNEVSRTKVLKL